MKPCDNSGVYFLPYTCPIHHIIRLSNSLSSSSVSQLSPLLPYQSWLPPGGPLPAQVVPFCCDYFTPVPTLGLTSGLRMSDQRKYRQDHVINYFCFIHDTKYTQWRVKNLNVPGCHAVHQQTKTIKRLTVACTWTGWAHFYILGLTFIDTCFKYYENLRIIKQPITSNTTQYAKG